MKIIQALDEDQDLENFSISILMSLYIDSERIYSKLTLNQYSNHQIYSKVRIEIGNHHFQITSIMNIHNPI